MESRGEIRGGRFVASFIGEQFALPEALDLLRAIRRNGETAPDSSFQLSAVSYQQNPVAALAES
jgi:ATP-dependent Lhr-like helicase